MWTEDTPYVSLGTEDSVSLRTVSHCAVTVGDTLQLTFEREGPECPEMFTEFLTSSPELQQLYLALPENFNSLKNNTVYDTLHTCQQTIIQQSVVIARISKYLVLNFDLNF